MSIKALKKLVPPPKHPAFAGTDADWELFEAEFPFQLPADYREFIQTYGYGDLGDMFGVISPFQEPTFPSLKGYEYTEPFKGKNDTFSLYQQINSNVEQLCEDEGWLEGATKNGLPGLIRFGCDTNGHGLFWLTSGAPKKWPILIGHGGSWHIHRFDVPLANFLTRALRFEIEIYQPPALKRVFWVRGQPSSESPPQAVESPVPSALKKKRTTLKILSEPTPLEGGGWSYLEVKGEKVNSIMWIPNTNEERKAVARFEKAIKKIDWEDDGIHKVTF